MIKDKGHVREGTIVKTTESRGGRREEMKSVKLKGRDDR